MKFKLFFILSITICIVKSYGQYNTMTMPEALYGTTFNLNIHESIKQLVTGNQTITGSINNETFWGPTLFINKGDDVHMNVTNNLNESTTIHWHGMHLPSVMDGGPHQVIPAGTLWQPYWTVMNQASTLWYHPHLHETTQAQITKGIGGFIIVKDPIESALALPRTYGTDDIVLALTSRSFNTTTNTFVTPPASTRVYGDYMLTNGTLNAQYTLPKQYVRMRILNAEIERGYNLGFSDNRNFYIIGNDGGLLNAPVTTNRIKLMVGERVEILVDLSNDVVGTSIDLKAYNSGQSNSFPGGEPATSGTFGSLLNNTTFNVLHINIGATTANPIIAVPSTLANNTYWTAADATVNRTIAITNGQPGGTPFNFDNTTFSLTMTPKVVNLNDIEKWTITNTNGVFGHGFHLHDVEFKIISRSTGAVGAYESGWKDTFFISRNETVVFVAKFDDFADSDVNHPYMYHCHFAGHEDGGMMGQFIVSSALSTNVNAPSTEFSLYPNPTSDKLFVNLKDASAEIYYVTISTIEGRIVLMLPQPQWQNGIDISSLESGIYTFQMMDKETKSVTTRKFIKK
ncbi:multicopper oxidase domain-containing protein [Flavobacterium sp. SUN052]|uniref:multicopper oxidase domain-containing protein n=1 Tax=Flavobacterium sp. SUN052 TaxID=3002441 RepID=UPI00237DE700|nr:multicopper oxidase domain-containing protein [Flavobacterium sp. SUN052]MEC4003479.1 multicopper oxidase domain-containing protein [Flavobacterium sp. SUN052]